MFKYIPIKQKLLNAIKQSELAKYESRKNTANIDYIAMMTGIDLDEVNENEISNIDEEV